MTPRGSVLARVADRVAALRSGVPVRVGVDGPDGAGKTWFADDLAGVLQARGVEVVRASVDGFHHPRAVRYRRGRSSPEGFFLDSYDHDALRRELLDPFAPGGSRTYRTAVHDVRTDEPVTDGPHVASHDAVLLVDGIFLHRDELVGTWDLSVYLVVRPEVTFARMSVRDGCPPDPQDLANRRYVVGQRLYRERCDPADRADLVVDDDDPAAPVVVREQSDERRNGARHR